MAALCEMNVARVVWAHEIMCQFSFEALPTVPLTDRAAEGGWQQRGREVLPTRVFTDFGEPNIR
jgi:hypothetical protein